MTFPFSKARLAANRANAEKSTGPKTEAGKAVSSRNAFKHGLASANLFVPEHLKPLYDEITEDLSLAIAPEGTLEDDAFSQLRNARFLMERILILQADLGRQSAARGLDYLTDPEAKKQFESLQRYYQTAQSNFRANMRELRKLQSERVLRQAAPSESQSLPGYAEFSSLAPKIRHQKRASQKEAMDALHAFITGPTPGEMGL